MKCPQCGNQLDQDNFCFECMKFFDESDTDDDSEYSTFDDSDDYSFEDEDVDFDSRVDNGEAICLNCTYWSVSPYGSAYGMICRRGNFTEGPGDSCMDFIQEHYFANYGDEGQFQFNETARHISNKLYYWKNSR
ncbi:MAG: hypothetical protein IJL02_08870 [Methanobrevibacter sp.]|uniref:hypothetical protein n=1 Tax=Methanobrevibacter sp. TaxID=66852 RepID=UPI0025D4CF59|nr:hypothetical protein [Methanobrevibacter sp.]MBQ6099950.1 hypothetical protein [Methanobrevibacter sp.]